MMRHNQTELLELTDLPDRVVTEAYRDLARIHYWLGDTGLVVRAIRSDPAKSA